MLSNSRRFVLVVALLAAAVAVTWAQRWSLDVTASAQLPRPAGEVPSDDSISGTEATPVPEFVYFLDVEGWYRVTPYETVVSSPFDLTPDSSEAMSESLPDKVGDWLRVGPDEYVAEDPAVVYYLGNPTVALQRAYQDSSGQKLTLAIIGNRGEESYLLFSHTPETCYPGRLWQVSESRRESAFIDDRQMHAQYLLTEHADTGQKLMVLYWYQWESPQRRSEDGVLSVRVNLFVPPDQDVETTLNRAWDFVKALYPATIPWERF
jgi:hypothetical protein